jgi:hypothetical protein
VNDIAHPERGLDLQIPKLFGDSTNSEDMEA